MDIIEAILQLPKQCEQAWKETLKLDLPKKWSDSITDIIVCGMGGSALGAHIFQLTASLKIPLEINNNYSLPFRANENTLIILSSYSGGTEEVLSCAEDAKNKGCKIIGITSGGKLGDWLTTNNYPSYIFDPKFNTTGQPRMGVGYGLFALFAIAELLNLSIQNTLEEDYRESLNLLENNLEEINAKAKELAPKLSGKMPYYFGAEYLAANAHIFANQTNETAKSYSAWVTIPEANHHFIEGLKHPQIPAIAVFLGSQYSQRILKRFEITKELLEKNGWEVYWYKTKESSPLSQALEVLLFSSLVTAYLGKDYGEDPLDIPNVDYFKRKLGEK